MKWHLLPPSDSQAGSFNNKDRHSHASKVPWGTSPVQRDSGLSNFEKALEKHVDSRIIFYSSSVCSNKNTNPSRKKKNKNLLRHFMTTPNTSVCYIYSLSGSISRLLQDRICLFLMSPASPPNPTFNAPTWKSLFSRNPATLNSSISLGTTPLKTPSQMQSTHHSWLPSPATSLQLSLETVWADGWGHLKPDLAHCSVLWSPTLTRRRWGKQGGEEVDTITPFGSSQSRSSISQTTSRVGLSSLLPNSHETKSCFSNQKCRNLMWYFWDLKPLYVVKPLCIRTTL